MKHTLLYDYTGTLRFSVYAGAYAGVGAQGSCPQCLHDSPQLTTL